MIASLANAMMLQDIVRGRHASAGHVSLLIFPVNFFRLTAAGIEPSVAGAGKAPSGLRYRFNVLSDGRGDSEMRISRNSYLAVECLVRLVRQEEAGPCTAKTLAQWIHRSDAYTEIILARLRAAGLVRSVRGPGGGYRLARAAHTISVAEILTAVEEWAGRPVRSANVTSVEPQTAGKIDGSALLWRSLESHVLRYLEQILLVDLATQGADEWHDGHTHGAADVVALSGLAETVEQ